MSGNGQTSTAGGQETGVGVALSTTAHSVQQQQQERQQQQQQGQRSSSIASGDFIGVFDKDGDGVLGPLEFQQLVKVRRL
jgi:hypothetical protein